jgi:hypothetical protein
MDKQTENEVSWHMCQYDDFCICIINIATRIPFSKLQELLTLSCSSSGRIVATYGEVLDQQEL